MSSETAQRRRLESARRQREYRQRVRLEKSRLAAIARETDVLEDAVKLAANKGDRLAMEICAGVQYPNASGLIAFFMARAHPARATRSASRNKKKNTQADDGAGVFL